MVEVGPRKYPTRAGIATACHPVRPVGGRSVSGAVANICSLRLGLSLRKQVLLISYVKPRQPTNVLRSSRVFIFANAGG